MGIFTKLFSKKRKKSYPLDWVGLDIHNHLLPGIDDGSESLEDSINLIKGLQDIGIHHAIATPHIMAGVHPNSHDTIKPSFNALKEALEEKKIDFKLNYAAEHMIDVELSDKIKNNELCLLPNKHVLIEMSYLQESQNLFIIIQELIGKGLQPVLAHPERYNYYHQNFDVYKRIKDSGCLLQLNLLSVTRYYGDHVKPVALSLIKSGMYDFVGTDLHHKKHLRALEHLTEKYDTRNLLRNNPIKNKELIDDKGGTLHVITHTG